MRKGLLTWHAYCFTEVIVAESAGGSRQWYSAQSTVSSLCGATGHCAGCKSVDLNGECRGLYVVVGMRIGIRWQHHYTAEIGAGLPGTQPTPSTRLDSGISPRPFDAAVVPLDSVVAPPDMTLDDALAGERDEGLESEIDAVFDEAFSTMTPLYPILHHPRIQRPLKTY